MINILGLIIIACWLIFASYWIISARNLKPTKMVKKDLWKLRIAIFLVVIFLIIVYRFLGVTGCRLSVLGCHYNFLTLNNNSLFFKFPAAIFSVLGIFIAVLGRKQLADNWSASVELKKGHELIMTGIYAYLRHPIYSGMFLMALGSALFINTLVVWTVLGVGVVLFYGYKIKQEEKLMTETFPKEYPEYKKKVKALIPYIF